MFQPSAVKKAAQSVLTVQATEGRTLATERFINRDDLCSLSRPLLKNSQYTHDFYFPQATLIIILSGSLVLHSGVSPQILTPSTQGCLIAQHTCIDIEKYPDADGQPFQSLFLTISAQVVRAFSRRYANVISAASAIADISLISVSEEMMAALFTLQSNLTRTELSNNRLELKLVDLLLILAEQGHYFMPQTKLSTALHLRELLQKSPEQHWTVKEAGKKLAMSESTLRRRLAAEHARFETLLLETRMMHAMSLLQTTSLSLQLIAGRCGYLSYSRFAEQFKKRFSTPPSAIR